MKNRAQHRNYFDFVSAMFCAVSLAFTALIGGRALAGEKEARLDSAEIMKLEPPLTLQALIERVGDISRKGLSDSKDIYTETMLSRLFGGKTISVRAVNNAPYTEVFWTEEYALPYASSDGLQAQGVKAKLDGRFVQNQQGNTSITLSFNFLAGGPDRRALETMLRTKLMEIKSPGPPAASPHGGPPPPTSPDGNKRFRADTQANSVIGEIGVSLGPDGKLSGLGLVQGRLDQSIK